MNKRILNSVYKRFECLKCGEIWEIGEKHQCKKDIHSIEDMFWDNLTTKEKQGYRKEFAASDDYGNYDSVSKWLYFKKFIVKG